SAHTRFHRDRGHDRGFRDRHLPYPGNVLRHRTTLRWAKRKNGSESHCAAVDACNQSLGGSQSVATGLWPVQRTLLSTQANGPQDRGYSKFNTLSRLAPFTTAAI